LGAKEAYDDVIANLSKKDASPNSLFEDFLNEKALDIS
jgi:hypothetical protein